MPVHISRTLGRLLASAIAVVLVASPAWAETLETSHQPPFSGTEAYGSCDDPTCRSSASADGMGALGAETELLSAVMGRTEAGIAYGGFVHTLQAPADELRYQLRVHVDEAFAFVFGGLQVRADALVGLDAIHTAHPAASSFDRLSVASASAPLGDVRVEDQDLVLSSTVKLSGGQKIRAGQILLWPYALAEAAAAAHAPRASGYSACADDCLAVGKAHAGIALTVESLTVTEIR